MISTSISQRQLILEYLAKEIRSAYCCGAEFFDVTFGTKFDFTLRCFFFTSESGNRNFIELTLDLRKKCLVLEALYFYWLLLLLLALDMSVHKHNMFFLKLSGL